MEKQLKLISLTLFTLVVASCGGGSGDSGTDFEISPGGVFTTVSEVSISEIADLPDQLSELINGRTFVLDEFETDISQLGELSSFTSNLQTEDTFLITEDGQAIFRASIDLGSVFGTGRITESNSDGILGEFQIQAILVEEGFSEEDPISVEGFVEDPISVEDFVEDPISIEDFVRPTITEFSGECQATGSLVERLSFLLSLDCISEDGTQETFDFDLVAAQDCSDISCSNAETVYETVFTLESIAGTYDEAGPAAAAFGFNIVEQIDQIEISPSGNISGLSEITSNGEVILSCDINGEISIVEEGFNLFDMELSMDGCVFPDPIDDRPLDEGEGSVFISAETAPPAFPAKIGLMTVRAVEDQNFLQLLSTIQSEELPNFVSTTIYERVPESP